MSRKRSGNRKRGSSGAAPQAAQLEAVRRLVYRGRDKEARERLKVLRTAFPGFKPLLGLAWEVEHECGDDFRAALCAWEWAEASRDSLQAVECLYVSAAEAGLEALATVAHQRASALSGEPLEAEDTSPDLFDGMTPEQASVLDRATLLMHVGRYVEAGDLVSDLDHAVARNTLALSLEARGDLAAAAAAYEDAWRREPRKLFPLLRLLKLRLWLSGRMAREELREALRNGMPGRPSDAVIQLTGLLLLSDFAAADASWNEAEQHDYWTGAAPVLGAAFHYLGAAAALRLGRRDDGRERCRRALDIDPAYEPALALEKAMGCPVPPETIEIELGDPLEWFPHVWMEALRRIALDNAAVWDVMEECDASAAYLGLAGELGNEPTRILARSVLHQRAFSGNAAARRQLLALLTRPCGSDEARIQLHARLAEDGILPSDAPVQVLLDGEIREITQSAC